MAVVVAGAILALILGSVLLAAILCIVHRLVFLVRKRYTERSLSAQTTDTSDDCQPINLPSVFPSPPPKYSVLERESKKVGIEAGESSHPLTSGIRGLNDSEEENSESNMVLPQPPSYEEVMRSESIHEEMARNSMIEI